MTYIKKKKSIQGQNESRMVYLVLIYCGPWLVEIIRAILSPNPVQSLNQ